MKKEIFQHTNRKLTNFFVCIPEFFISQNLKPDDENIIIYIQPATHFSDRKQIFEKNLLLVSCSISLSVDGVFIYFCSAISLPFGSQQMC